MPLLQLTKTVFDVSALVLWEWYYSEKYLHLGHETVTASVVMKPLTACAAGLERRRHIVVAEKARCQQQLGYGPRPSRRHLVAPVGTVYRIHGPVETVIETNADVQGLGRLLQAYELPSADDVCQRLAETVPDEASKDDVFAYLSDAVAASLGGDAPVDAPSFAAVNLAFKAFQIGT